MFIQSRDNHESDEDKYHPEDSLEYSAFIRQYAKFCNNTSTSESDHEEHESESECIDQGVADTSDEGYWKNGCKKERIGW